MVNCRSSRKCPACLRETTSKEDSHVGPSGLQPEQGNPRSPQVHGAKFKTGWGQLHQVQFGPLRATESKSATNPTQTPQTSQAQLNVANKKARPTKSRAQTTKLKQHQPDKRTPHTTPAAGVPHKRQHGGQRSSRSERRFPWPPSSFLADVLASWENR